MAKQIKSEILINASPEKVWSILIDFKNYKTWNSFITSIDGEVAPGKMIRVHISPPGTKGMTLQPKVLDLETNKRFRWLGHLLFPGLFDGEHSFELIDNGNGSTTFIHSERFRGILVPFLAKMLDVNTLNGFKLMNEGLKKMVEEGVN